MKLYLRAHVRTRFRICHFIPLNEHRYPRQLTELQGEIFFAHFTCHVMLKKKKTTSPWDAWADCTYEKWWVCFWQALKRSRQMALLSMGEASVTDQGEGGTWEKTGTGTETSFSTVAQTKLSHRQSLHDQGLGCQNWMLTLYLKCVSDRSSKESQACTLSLLHSFINPLQYLPVTSQTVASFPIDCAIDLIDGWTFL